MWFLRLLGPCSSYLLESLTFKTYLNGIAKHIFKKCTSVFFFFLMEFCFHHCNCWFFPSSHKCPLQDDDTRIVSYAKLHVKSPCCFLWPLWNPAWFMCNINGPLFLANWIVHKQFTHSCILQKIKIYGLDNSKKEEKKYLAKNNIMESTQGR